MGKFTDMTTNVLAVFNSNAWLLEGVATFPSNFTGSVASNEYIRIDIVATDPKAAYANLNCVSGQILIDIFTPAGEGPSRSVTIADLLDTYLVGKSFSSGNGVAQLGLSMLVSFGLDKANPMLYRSQYSLSFTYFGK